MSASVSTSTNSNPLIPQFNIGGLASGLDTNSIIQAIMNVAQQPQQAIINQQTLETTRQTDLQNIQAQLATLSGSLATLVSPSTWTTAQQIVSSDPAHVTATGVGVPPGGYDISVSQLARAAQLTQTSSLTQSAGDDQLTIQVGSASGFTVNVAAVVGGKLALSGQVTGAANTISVTSTGGGTLAADLGLTQTVTPRDAQYSVDEGPTQTSASNVITNVASGLTVTLQGTTSSPVSIIVEPPEPNTDAVQAAIQSFVTTYNQTVDMISAKVNEQKVVDPQTDA